MIKWPSSFVLLHKATVPAGNGWLRSVGSVRLRQSIVNQTLKLSRCV